MKIVLPDSVISSVLNQEKVSGAPHDFYRYPARFSPLFVREAVKAFTQPGDLVLDPFCGGGTTVVEAMVLGRRAAGMDVSSLAAFLTRTKTTPISVRDEAAILGWLDGIIAESEPPRLLPDDDSLGFEVSRYKPLEAQREQIRRLIDTIEQKYERKNREYGLRKEQLKKLGCSCDWSRERFTMDPEYSRCVQRVFVELYRKGLIYRGKRMVNWDPAARTALSDEEVEMVERAGADPHQNLVGADRRLGRVFVDEGVRPPVLVDSCEFHLWLF